jgi:hypothetical protein
MAMLNTTIDVVISKAYMLLRVLIINVQSHA